MTPPLPPSHGSLLLKANVAVIGVAVLCLAFAAPVAYGCSGPVGLRAAVPADATCCLGAIGSLCVSPWLRSPSRMLIATLVGMSTRLGVSLSAATVIQLTGGPLAEAGFVYYLLLFYMVTLIVETVVVVRLWST